MLHCWKTVMQILFMKKTSKLFLIVILLFIFSGCQREQTEDIYILYTNDVASAVNEGVTYAGVKGYYDEMKSQHKYVGLVDSGDFYDGKVASMSHGDYITDIMNKIGYEFVAIGNQEFSIGLDNLQRNIKNSKFKFLSCNIKFIGRGRNKLNKVKSYEIKRYGPTKIAFIGVTTPETLNEGKNAYEAISQDGKPLYYFYEDDPQLLYQQVQKTVNKVRNRVDYVIVLSHLGSNSVKEGYSSYDLIQNTNGIDVVLDGHSHTVIHGEPVNNMDGDMVVLTSTGKELENIGVLSIHPDHSFTTVLYPSVENKDPQIQELCDSIMSLIN